MKTPAQAGAHRRADHGARGVRGHPHALPDPSVQATTALIRVGIADADTDAGYNLVEDHARCYPPADPGLVLDPLYPDRLGEDYLALTLPGHEDEFGYHATDPVD